jgi:hypothetical protein
MDTGFGSGQSSVAHVHAYYRFILYKNKSAPRKTRCRELRDQVQNIGSEAKVSTCENGEGEEAVVIPPTAGLDPASVQPPTATEAVRIEDARVAVRILDGVVKSGDVPGSAHLFHLLVGNRLADARDVATERLAITILLHAALTQSIGGTVGIALDFLARHERQLIRLVGDEPVVLVVAVLFLGQQARLEIVAQDVTSGFEPLGLLGTRQVEAGHGHDDVAVLIAFEHCWAPAGLTLDELLEFRKHRLAISPGEQVIEIIFRSPYSGERKPSEHACRHSRSPRFKEQQIRANPLSISCRILYTILYKSVK